MFVVTGTARSRGWEGSRRKTLSTRGAAGVEAGSPRAAVCLAHPGTRDPGWPPRSHLLAAHGCEDLRAVHGRPGSLLRDPRTQGQRCAPLDSSLSLSSLSFSELGALASLPPLLPGNKLAGSTSGHRELLCDQAQNFLGGPGEWLPGAT